jgi:lipid A ethanolaminephosphotransferase
MWFGSSFEIDKNAIKAKVDRVLSHDNVFHTVLGIMGVESKIYRKNLDFLTDERDES